MPNFTDQLKNELNRIVPIVCDDMFEYVKSEEDTPISLKEFISVSLEPDDYSELYDTLKNKYYYGISQYEMKNEDNYSSFIYNTVKGGVDNGRIRLKECVREFLVKGKFPLIITTFAFPVIETCLEKELGQEQKDTVKSIYYNIDARNDLPLVFAKRYNHYVYHIFGGERHDRWVYNEQTLLQYMYALQNADIGAKNLASYICPTDNVTRLLLVMGSILPDWLFRFLVYPIYKDNLSVGGFWISAQDTAQELKAFLLRNKYKFPKTNNIPNILHNAITEREVHKMSGHNIFVSYKRDDSDKRIGRVIDLLRLYGQVWIDFEKVSDAGNPYWANIKEGIKKCDVFIPLVTDKYKEVFSLNQEIDLEKLILDNPYVDEDVVNKKHNDNYTIDQLAPIVREAYYAVACKKKICPIAISSDPKEPGNIETMAKKGLLPSCIFSGMNIICYNDNIPTELNIIFND